ncbi:DUF2383 domain-containing protein [Alteromonas lipotrueiana]|uniref:DUF2383 domain-containing protein n=1 Tax=Alteromonas lipotrueiana TaxID=2803815 RepID=UPI001C466896|nr:DUF2383 domain-containing protein [Alteromonas lipotrueiana]
MNQLPANIDLLNDIIKVLNGGIKFYNDGLNKIADHNAQAMFNRMLLEKKQAVRILSSYLPSQSPESEKCPATRSKGIKTMYKKLLNTVNPTNAYNYVTQLKAIEDKVLAKIDNALKEHPPQKLACDLRRIRCRLQQCREEIGTFHYTSAIAG